MAAGANAGGFGAGFGRGLAKALLLNRERGDQKTREEQARKDRLFTTMLPVYLQNVEDPADLEPLLQQQFPEMFATKGKKGQPSNFAKIAEFLKPFAGLKKGQIFNPGSPAGNDLPEQGGITGNLPRSSGGTGLPRPTGGEDIDAYMRRRRGELGLGVEGQAPAATQQQQPTGPLPTPVGTSTPSTALAKPFDQPPDLSQTSIVPGASPAQPAQPAQRRTLMGVPIMSEDEKIERDLSHQTRVAAGLMQRARDVVLPAMKSVMPEATLEDALRVLGIQFPRSSTTEPYQSVAGTVNGEPAFGVFDQAHGTYVDPVTHKVLPNFRPKTEGSDYHYGVDREAIARAAFGKDYGKLTTAQQQVVLDQEKVMLEREAKARGTGTAQAKFEAPTDLAGAQAAGVNVGTSAADVAGQRVPTSDERQRRQSLTVVQSDLRRVQDLLKVLPSENDAAGIAPGGVLAVRRRMNTDSGLKDAQGKPISYRTAIAQLQSVVDSMVNVLARTRGEQRGTQTERDAERAYNAVVQLQAGLLDPLGGDTQESAAARIAEALDGLDRVLASLPTAPVSAKPPAGKSSPAGNQPVTPGAGAAGGPAKPATPAGTVPGMTMDAKGNLYQDGKLVIPAQ